MTWHASNYYGRNCVYACLLISSASKMHSAILPMLPATALESRADFNQYKWFLGKVIFNDKFIIYSLQK